MRSYLYQNGGRYWKVSRVSGTKRRGDRAAVPELLPGGDDDNEQIDMIPPTTYIEFHLVFTLPVIALLAALAWWRGSALDGPVPAAGLGILIVLAVVYTTLWDNLLIKRGVWWYGEDVVWARIWAAPVGEYAFFVLQPLITILFLAQLSIPTDSDLRLTRRERLLGVLGGLAVSAVGGALMLTGASGLYLGSTLLWAGPILAIQWGFGWTHLWRSRRTVAIAVLVPTLYLWIADYTAIRLGLWTISETYTLGIAPFGFPIEEAFFFFITNVFVVQGFVLYLWLIEQWPTVADSPRLLRCREYIPGLTVDRRRTNDHERQ